MKDVLLQATVKEQICANLTFEEAVQLREVLSLTHLECQIQDKDRYGKTVTFPGVNTETIQLYKLVKQYGADLSLLLVIYNSDPEIPVSRNLYFSAYFNKELKLSLKDSVFKVKLFSDLLKIGASPNTIDDYSQYPVLFVAIKRGQNSLIPLLIQAGADIKRKSWGDTPLWAATHPDNPKALALLIQAGADVNEKNQWNQTLLFPVAENNAEESAKILIEAGIDVWHADNYGKRAYDAALEFNSQDVLKLILATADD